MQLAWIESHDTLGEHPKIYDLSASLNVDKATTIGLLHLLWHFTLKYAWRDGDLSRFSKEAICAAIGWKNDADMFFSALQSNGWLDDMVVHDWMDYAGKIVKDRLYRESKSRRKTPKKGAERRKTRLPNRTVPNLTNKDISNDISTNKPKADKPLNPLQQIVLGWKVLNDVDKNDKAWDKAHFSRYSKSAKTLLELFGDVGTVLDCIDWVWNDLTPKGFTVTLETVVNHSDRFRNKNVGGKHGMVRG